MNNANVIGVDSDPLGYLTFPLTDADLAEAREAIVRLGVFCYQDSGEDDPAGEATRLWLEALALPPSVLVICTQADCTPDAITAPPAPSPTPAPRPEAEKPASAPLMPSVEAVSDSEHAAMLDKRLRPHGYAIQSLGLYDGEARFALKQVHDRAGLDHGYILMQGSIDLISAHCFARIFNLPATIPWQGQTIEL